MSLLDRRALLIGAGLAGLATRAEAAATPKIDQPAPPFDVFTYDWRKIRFADMAGKVTVLHFWAGWCQSCLRELPRLDAYYREQQGAPLQIFAARVQDNVENPDFAGFVKRFAFDFAWHVEGRAYGPIRDQIPTSYVIDREGILRYAKGGAFTSQGLEQVITPLFTRSAPVTQAPTVMPVVRDDSGVSDAGLPPSVTSRNVPFAPKQVGF